MFSILLIILFFSLIIWWDLVAYEVFAAACIALSLLLISDFRVESTILTVAGSLSGFIFMTCALYLVIRPALIKPKAHQLAQLNSSEEKTREKIQTVERNMITYAHSEALIEQAKRDKDQWRKRIRLEIEVDQQKTRNKIT